MKHTKTIKNLRIILVCFLALASIKLCYSILGFIISLFINGGGDPYQSVSANYELSPNQINELVEAGYPGCTKVYYPNGNSARQLSGFGYSSKTKKFEWKYTTVDSGECQPRNLGYHYAVSSRSLSGVMLFLFRFIRDLLIVACTYFLIKILTNTLKKHPFVNENSIKLRWIAIAIFGYAVIDWLYRDIVMEVVNMLHRDMEGFIFDFNSEKINFTLILIGFLVLIISSVFKYGYQLKTENDLTI